MPRVCYPVLNRLCHARCKVQLVRELVMLQGGDDGAGWQSVAGGLGRHVAWRCEDQDEREECGLCERGRWPVLATSAAGFRLAGRVSSLVERTTDSTADGPSWYGLANLVALSPQAPDDRREKRRRAVGVRSVAYRGCFGRSLPEGRPVWLGDNQSLAGRARRRSMNKRCAS